MQLILLDSPALLRIALRIIPTASLLRYRCKIFCSKFYTVTLTGVRTGTVSPSHGLQRPVSRTMLPFLGKLYLFWNYFKMTNLCACRCQCLQSSPLENLLPGLYSPTSKHPADHQGYSFSGNQGFSLFWDLTLKLHLLWTLVGKVANLTCVVISLHACIELNWRQ